MNTSLNLRTRPDQILAIEATLPHHLRNGTARTILLSADVGHIDPAVDDQLDPEGIPSEWNPTFKGTIVSFGCILDLASAHLNILNLGLVPASRLENLLVATFGLNSDYLDGRIVVLEGTFLGGKIDLTVGLANSFAFGARVGASKPGRDFFHHGKFMFAPDSWFLCKNRELTAP